MDQHRTGGVVIRERRIPLRMLDANISLEFQWKPKLNYFLVNYNLVGNWLKYKHTQNTYYANKLEKIWISQIYINRLKRKLVNYPAIFSTAIDPND